MTLYLTISSFWRNSELYLTIMTLYWHCDFLSHDSDFISSNWKSISQFQLFSQNCDFISLIQNCEIISSDLQENQRQKVTVTFFIFNPISETSFPIFVFYWAEATFCSAWFGVDLCVGSEVFMSVRWKTKALCHRHQSQPCTRSTGAFNQTLIRLSACLSCQMIIIV